MAFAHKGVAQRIQARHLEESEVRVDHLPMPSKVISAHRMNVKPTGWCRFVDSVSIYRHPALGTTVLVAGSHCLHLLNFRAVPARRQTPKASAWELPCLEADQEGGPW